VLEIRAMNEEKIIASTHNVHRSRSPIRHPVPEGPPPMMGCCRVPVFEDHVVETRVPMVERVDRTIESVPVGHHRAYVESRSRSPLLHTSTYPAGGYGEISRLSAATPTVHKTTIEEK